MNKLLKEDHFVIPNTQVIQGLIENYRYQLIEEYQNRISLNWAEDIDLELIEYFMCKAIKVINSSEEEILNRLIKHISKQCADISIGEYFNDLFEGAI